jgi:alkanesulfonate monooxygenase SsuD/methylene tetrahydromethanopterin reductase-like flavin-dependent oxidoreductase (luciferase family)
VVVGLAADTALDLLPAVHQHARRGLAARRIGRGRHGALRREHPIQGGHWMSTVRFGLDISTSAADGAEPVRAAKRAEELGFDFVSASDHPCGDSPSFETWTMLTWIAASTSRVGIASRVLGVPYRAPAMVAKMAESLDRLSGNRLILGLGAGYSDDEFRAFGLGVPTPREKVDGLAEAITVIRGLWTEPDFSFDGRIHHTDHADLEPKPARAIPIWLGTFGPRALAVTGRLADGWIPSHGYVAIDQVLTMRSRVLEAARDAGRDPAELTCAYNVSVRIDAAAARDPDMVTGSVDAVVDQLTSFIGLGFTTLNLMPLGPDTDHQTELLAAEVIPALRA